MNERLDDNYKLLAAKIIKQAAIDYKRCLKAKQKGKKMITLDDRSSPYPVDFWIKDYESFFLSSWFDFLTQSNLDGRFLLKKLRDTVSKE